MQIEILAKRENPLLKRVEVTFKATHKKEATPTRDILRAELAKELRATKEIVVVSRARSTFGRYETLGYAKLYKSKEQALAVERRHVLVRNKLAEKKAAKEAKPAAAAPAKPAKPAPPKKEEPKHEEKPEAKREAKAEPKAEAKPPAKPEKKAEKHEAKKPEPKKKEG